MQARDVCFEYECCSQSKVGRRLAKQKLLDANGDVEMGVRREAPSKGRASLGCPSTRRLGPDMQARREGHVGPWVKRIWGHLDPRLFGTPGALAQPRRAHDVYGLRLVDLGPTTVP